MRHVTEHVGTPQKLSRSERKAQRRQRRERRPHWSGKSFLALLLGVLGLPAAFALPFFISFAAIGLASIAWVEFRSDKLLRGRPVAAAAMGLGVLGVIISFVVGLNFFLSL